MRLFSSNEKLNPRDIQRNLSRFGCVVAPCAFEAPQEEAFLALVSELGHPLGNPTVHVPGFKHGCVDIISALSGAKTYKDGSEIRSTTNTAMQCHTDGYNDPDPIGIIAMFVSIGDSRVRSIVAHIDDILSHLEQETNDVLQQPIFPRAGRYGPVMEYSDHGFTLRYDRYEIERAIEAGQPILEASGFHALNMLDCAVQASCQEVTLQDNEIMVLDNRRVLHGRTEVPRDSRRTLMRVRARTPVNA